MTRSSPARLRERRRDEKISVDLNGGPDGRAARVRPLFRVRVTGVPGVPRPVQDSGVPGPQSGQVRHGRRFGARARPGSDLRDAAQPVQHVPLGVAAQGLAGGRSAGDGHEDDDGGERQETVAGHGEIVRTASVDGPQQHVRRLSRALFVVAAA